MVRRFFCGGKCPTGEEVGNEAAYKCQKRGDSGRWNRARHLTTVLVEFSDGAIVEQCSPVGDGWLSCGLENTWLASICTLSNQRRFMFSMSNKRNADAYPHDCTKLDVLVSRNDTLGSFLMRLIYTSMYSRQLPAWCEKADGYTFRPRGCCRAKSNRPFGCS